MTASKVRADKTARMAATLELKNQGVPNKVIADILGVQVVTVEKYVTLMRRNQKHVQSVQPDQRKMSNL